MMRMVSVCAEAEDMVSLLEIGAVPIRKLYMFRRRGPFPSFGGAWWRFSEASEKSCGAPGGNFPKVR